MRRYKKQISRIVTIAMLFAFLVGNSNMVHAMDTTQIRYASKYITVKGNKMHLAWKEYEISGADRMFVERASKILEPYEGESEDEK